MPLRASMADLISRLRKMIDDPVSATQFFTDLELQEYLDNYKSRVKYGELEGIDSFAPGGTASTLAFTYNAKPFESGVYIVDADYNVITPATEDVIEAYWTVLSEPANLPLYVSGTYYDMYSAAVEALQAHLARLRKHYTVSMAGQSFARSQPAVATQALIDQYRRKIKVKTVKQVRSDV